MATQNTHVPSASMDLDREAPWILRGVVNGVVGASAVAVFFLILDFLRGQPFWTPHALGSALLLGRGVAPGDPIQPSLVVAYSAAHGTVFLAAGACAAFALADASIRQVRKLALAIMIAGTLFTAFAISFLLFAAVFGQEVATQLGTGRVALANLVAAGAMAVVLVYFQHPGEGGAA